MLEHFNISLILFGVSILVSIIVLFSRMRFAIKIFVVLLLSASSILTYRAFNELHGYPAALQVSFKDVLVISHRIDEDKKVIYLWLQTQGESPRSYTVPHSAKMAGFLDRMRRRHRGRPYRVKMKTTTDPMSPLSNSVKDVEIGELKVFPPKKTKEMFTPRRTHR